MILTSRSLVRALTWTASSCCSHVSAAYKSSGRGPAARRDPPLGTEALQQHLSSLAPCVVHSRRRASALPAEPPDPLPSYLLRSRLKRAGGALRSLLLSPSPCPRRCQEACSARLA